MPHRSWARVVCALFGAALALLSIAPPMHAAGGLPSADIPTDIAAGALGARADVYMAANYQQFIDILNQHDATEDEPLNIRLTAPIEIPQGESVLVFNAHIDAGAHGFRVGGYLSLLGCTVTGSGAPAAVCSIRPEGHLDAAASSITALEGTAVSIAQDGLLSSDFEGPLSIRAATVGIASEDSLSLSFARIQSDGIGVQTPGELSLLLCDVDAPNPAAAINAHYYACKVNGLDMGEVLIRAFDDLGLRPLYAIGHPFPDTDTYRIGVRTIDGIQKSFAIDVQIDAAGLDMAAAGTQWAPVHIAGRWAQYNLRWAEPLQQEITLVDASLPHFSDRVSISDFSDYLLFSIDLFWDATDLSDLRLLRSDDRGASWAEVGGALDGNPLHATDVYKNGLSASLRLDRQQPVFWLKLSAPGGDSEVIVVDIRSEEIVRFAGGDRTGGDREESDAPQRQEPGAGDGPLQGALGRRINAPADRPAIAPALPVAHAQSAQPPESPPTDASLSGAWLHAATGGDSAYVSLALQDAWLSIPSSFFEQLGVGAQQRFEVQLDWPRQDAFRIAFSLDGDALEGPFDPPFLLSIRWEEERVHCQDEAGNRIDAQLSGGKAAFSLDRPGVYSLICDPHEPQAAAEQAQGEARAPKRNPTRAARPIGDGDRALPISFAAAGALPTWLLAVSSLLLAGLAAWWIAFGDRLVFRR